MCAFHNLSKAKRGEEKLKILSKTKRKVYFHFQKRKVTLSMKEYGFFKFHELFLALFSQGQIALPNCENSPLIKVCSTTRINLSKL